MLDAVGDEAHGYQEEKDGWNEGETDKGGYQFGPEPGSQDFPFSLKNQFYEVPDHQKDQQKDEDDIDINQAEDDDIVGDGHFAPDLGGFHLDRCEDENENGDDPDDDQLIASSSCVRGKHFLHHYKLRRFRKIPPNLPLPKGGITPL
jgi:hypothetical protein